MYEAFKVLTTDRAVFLLSGAPWKMKFGGENDRRRQQYVVTNLHTPPPRALGVRTSSPHGRSYVADEEVHLGKHQSMGYLTTFASAAFHEDFYQAVALGNGMYILPENCAIQSRRKLAAPARPSPSGFSRAALL